MANPTGQTVRWVCANRQTSPKEGFWFTTKRQRLEEEEVCECETQEPYLNPARMLPGPDWMTVADLGSYREESNAVVELKVEVTGVFMILNARFPHGCGFCAQEAA